MKPSTSILSAASVATLLLISIPAAGAQSAPVTDLTPQVQSAGLAVEGLRALEVGGIVVLRGRTDDRAVAERAGAFVQSLGYTRVANLIRVAEPPDDAAIERTAERQLARLRALEGCTFRVDSDRGILNIQGRVQSELQKDVALNALRNIGGVRAVKSELQK